MRRSILAMAVVMAFALFAAAQTSDTSSKGSTDKTSTSSGRDHGITGCLEQGSSAGTYVIKNAKHPNGVQVSYSGSEDLSKHVGHKVHATGSMSGDTLNATNVKHISETCSVESAGTGHKHHHGDMSNSSTGNDTSNTNNSNTNTSNPK